MFLDICFILFTIQYYDKYCKNDLFLSLSHTHTRRVSVVLLTRRTGVPPTKQYPLVFNIFTFIIIQFVKHICPCGWDFNMLYTKNYKGTYSQPYNKNKCQQTDGTMKKKNPTWLNNFMQRMILNIVSVLFTPSLLFFMFSIRSMNTSPGCSYMIQICQKM